MGRLRRYSKCEMLVLLGPLGLVLIFVGPLAVHPSHAAAAPKAGGHVLPPVAPKVADINPQKFRNPTAGQELMGWYAIQHYSSALGYVEIKADGSYQWVNLGMWDLFHALDYGRMSKDVREGQFHLSFHGPSMEDWGLYWTKRGEYDRVAIPQIDAWFHRVKSQLSSLEHAEGAEILRADGLWGIDDEYDTDGRIIVKELKRAVQVWSKYNDQGNPSSCQKLRSDGSLAVMSEGRWDIKGDTVTFTVTGGEYHTDYTPDGHNFANKELGVTLTRLASRPRVLDRPEEWLPPAASCAVRYPLIVPWKVAGARAFGFWNNDPKVGPGYHLGNDIEIKKGQNDLVYPMAPGRVRIQKSKDGIGYYMVIEHLIDGQPLCSVYIHMAIPQPAYMLREGQVVLPGLPIGRVSFRPEDNMNTFPHLHFGIRMGPFDPIKKNWDTRTNFSLYAGYTTIYPKSESLKDNPIHQVILKEWRDPAIFLKEHVKEPEKPSQTPGEQQPSGKSAAPAAKPAEAPRTSQ